MNTFNDMSVRKPFTQIRTTLLIVFGETTASLTEVIVFGNVIMSLLVFSLLFSELGLKMGLIAAIATMCIPYLLVRIRLHNIRIESSYEGEFLITELINQYKLCNFNMIEAIDSTISHLSDSPQSRRLLFQMSIRLKSYKNRSELENILDDFTYAINTQWSRMMINNLLLSIEDEFEVTTGLIDIQNELKRAKRAYEQGSRNTTEGFAIVKILIPGLYLFTVYMAIKYFDFSLEKFIGYQLFTPSGLNLFVWNGLLYILNIMFMVLFKRRKFDIT